MSDRVVVMKKGYIEQIDNPINIYKNPVSEYVADFVGTSNFFKGKLHSSYITNESFSDVKVNETPELENLNVAGAIRPEKIVIVDKNEKSSLVKENIISGKLIVIVFLGLMVRLVVKVKGMDLIVDCLEETFEKMGIIRGDMIDLYLPPEAITMYKDE